jgi:hypothetical protein
LTDGSRQFAGEVREAKTQGVQAGELEELLRDAPRDLTVVLELERT